MLGRWLLDKGRLHGRGRFYLSLFLPSKLLIEPNALHLFSFVHSFLLFDPGYAINVLLRERKHLWK